MGLAVKLMDLIMFMDECKLSCFLTLQWFYQTTRKCWITHIGQFIRLIKPVRQHSAASLGLL